MLRSLVRFCARSLFLFQKSGRYGVRVSVCRSALGVLERVLFLRARPPSSGKRRSAVRARAPGASSGAQKPRRRAQLCSENASHSP